MKNRKILLLCGVAVLVLAGCTMMPRPQPAAYVEPQAQPVVKRAVSAKPAAPAARKRVARKAAAQQTAAPAIQVAPPPPPRAGGGGPGSGGWSG